MPGSARRSLPDSGAEARVKRPNLPAKLGVCGAERAGCGGRLTRGARIRYPARRRSGMNVSQVAHTPGDPPVARGPAGCWLSDVQLPTKEGDVRVQDRIQHDAGGYRARGSGTWSLAPRA